MISLLSIKNFRSIDNLSINLGAINAFVGPNNSGKSNIMDALNLILGETYPSARSFDDKDFYNYNKSNPINIQVSFDQPLTTKTDVYGFKLSYEGDTCNYVAIGQTGDTLAWRTGSEVRVSNEMREEVSLLHLGLDRQAYQQIKATQWTIYGKLMKFIEKNIDSHKKESFKSDVERAYGINIAPNLADFIRSTKDYMKKQTGLALDFRLSAVDPIETLKNLRPFLRESGSTPEFDAENVGAGVQSALAVAIVRAYAEIVRGSPIMAIEEPELYLHPHGCRHFYNLLIDLSRNGIQLVYATHERSFVNVMDYQNVHLVRKRDGKTYVKSGNSLSMSSSEAMKIASKFDDSLNEIFFAKKVILVEGPVDKIAIRLALEKEGTDIDGEDISIAECGGRGTIKDIAIILKHFDIPLFIVVDDDPANSAAQRENRDLVSLAGSDKVFLQSPKLEGVFGLSRKPSKKEALEFFPSWFRQNSVPQIYLDLKIKLA